MIILIKNSSNFRKKSPFESILEIQAQEEDFDHHEDRATKERKQPARTLERNQFLCTVFRGELDKQQVLLPDQPKSVQGCIIRSILPSGMGARGVSLEHVENMEMFSCSLTAFFPSDGISRDGSKNVNIRTCEHMILGQLRMGARQTKNAPLSQYIIS